MVEQRNLYKDAVKHIKNHPGMYMAALAMAACTTLVLSRGCNGTRAPISEPIHHAPVRGDGVCEQEEWSPYMLDDRGRPRRNEAGQQIRNPHYSKEDCHDGDNVCDDATDRSALRDSEGNTIPDFMQRDAYGREIRLPLEGPNSIDCQLKPAREQACGAFPPGATPVDRPRISSPVIGLRQRSLREFAQFLDSHPPIVAGPRADAGVASVTPPQIVLSSSGDYFVVFTQYQETCNQALPICTPDSLEACWCPNIMECARPPPPPNPRACRNRRVDPGERCDPTARPTGCGANQSCVACRECVDNDPGHHNECRQNACVTVTGSGDNQCSSNADCAPPPPPPQIGPCPGHVRSQAIVSRVSGDVGSHADSVRNAAPELGGQTIPVDVTLRVNTSGVPSVQSIMAGSHSVPGIVDVSGITVPAPQDECFLTIRVPVSPL